MLSFLFYLILPSIISTSLIIRCHLFLSYLMLFRQIGMAASRRSRAPKEPCVLMEKLLHRLDVRTYKHLHLLLCLCVCVYEGALIQSLFWWRMRFLALHSFHFPFLFLILILSLTLLSFFNYLSLAVCNVNAGRAGRSNGGLFLYMRSPARRSFDAMQLPAFTTLSFSFISPFLPALVSCLLYLFQSSFFFHSPTIIFLS